MIIENGHHLQFPSDKDIVQLFPQISVNRISRLEDGLIDISSGIYSLVITGQDEITAQNGLLVKAYRYILPKPSIIAISKDPVSYNGNQNAIEKSCIYVYDNDNLRDNLLYAIPTALKCYKLNCELTTLHNRLKEVKFNQTIVDMALSHNNEMNNILTAIIGNIHLILKSSKTLDKDTLEKLSRIDDGAKQIQRMALNLVDKINAPAESLINEDQ